MTHPLARAAVRAGASDCMVVWKVRHHDRSVSFPAMRFRGAESKAMSES